MKSSEGVAAKAEAVDYQELLTQAESEVPAEARRRLGCDLESADPAEAESCLTKLLEEYNEKQNNAFRYHVEIAAKLLTWLKMAAKMQDIERELAGLRVTNDNQPALSKSRAA